MLCKEAPTIYKIGLFLLWAPGEKLMINVWAKRTGKCSNATLLMAIRTVEYDTIYKQSKERKMLVTTANI